MLQSNKPQIDRGELLSKLTVYISNVGEQTDPKKFLEQVEEVSELLVRRERDYEFAHLSFQGYLAAVEIKEKRQQDLLRQNRDKSWWWETIILYGAQLKPVDFRLFIFMLLEDSSEKAGDLAYRCWREYPRQVEPDLEAQVKQLNSYILDVRCSKLEDYLKNQQWEKADRETSRVMLQTMGREENGYLFINDIENFPCPDLRKIDQLWVKYSKGKFGFSVQKKIYQSLGCTKEYNWKVWETFCDKVGWRKGGKWLMWEQFTFSMDIHYEGHLPVALRVAPGMGIAWGVDWMEEFFSRAETCRL
jgi:hypothetical protein